MNGLLVALASFFTITGFGAFASVIVEAVDAEEFGRATVITYGIFSAIFSSLLLATLL